MKALVACECSGIFRDALISLGVDAMSCDLKPCERPGPHYQGDVRDVLGDGWDLLIAHPVCTRLTNAGAKHLYVGMNRENGREPGKWIEMEEGAAFFRMFDRADHIPFRAVENPIPHRWAVKAMGRPASQYVQPWWFGDPFFKMTGWWLTNLPKWRRQRALELAPPRPGTAEHKRWSRVHLMPPGPQRATERSRSHPAMAEHLVRHWVEAIRTPDETDLFGVAA